MPQQNNLDANTTAAALAHATSLQDQLMGVNPTQAQNQSQPDASQMPQNAPQEAETSGAKDSPQEEKGEDIGAKMTELELTMTKKLDEIRKEMKDNQAKEIEAIRQDIKSALAEDDAQEN